MAQPMMPRSSSGLFQAVFRPCVAVKTPPERRTDVLAEDVGHAEVLLGVVERQPDRLRHAGHQQVLRVDVLPDARAGSGMRLVADLAGLGGDLLGPPRADLVHLGAGEDAVRLEPLLEARDAVLLPGDEVRAGGAGVAVEPRDVRLEQERLPLRAHVVHRLLQLEVAGDRVVAVDGLGCACRTPCPRSAMVLASLLGRRRGGDAPLVVGDDDEDRQLVAGPAAPDQAAGEVALGRAGVAAGDDGDAVAAVALLGQRRARGPSRTAPRWGWRPGRCSTPAC